MLVGSYASKRGERAATSYDSPALNMHAAHPSKPNPAAPHTTCPCTCHSQDELGSQAQPPQQDPPHQVRKQRQKSHQANRVLVRSHAPKRGERAAGLEEAQALGLVAATDGIKNVMEWLCHCLLPWALQCSTAIRHDMVVLVRQRSLTCLTTKHMSGFNMKWGANHQDAISCP